MASGKAELRFPMLFWLIRSSRFIIICARDGVSVVRWTTRYEPTEPKARIEVSSRLLAVVETGLEDKWKMVKKSVKKGVSGIPGLGY